MNKNRAQEELAFIKKVMQDSQKILTDNGKMYIFWSGCAVLGLAIKFIMQALGIYFHNAWIWIPLIILGWLITFLWRTKHSEALVKTFAQRALYGVWTAWGVAIPILAIVAFFFHAVEPWAVPAIIATLLGSAHFASGVITNQTIIRYSGFAWWTGSIAMFVWPGEYAVLLLGVMIVVFQMIPGILLYRKWKREMKKSD